MLSLFRPKMTVHSNGDRWCEVGKLRWVFFEGKPCYEIDGRGDLGYYLGDADPLYVEETPHGWTVGYRPNDEHFAQWADGIVELGEWR